MEASAFRPYFTTPRQVINGGTKFSSSTQDSRNDVDTESKRSLGEKYSGELQTTKKRRVPLTFDSETPILVRLCQIALIS